MNKIEELNLTAKGEIVISFDCGLCGMRNADVILAHELVERLEMELMCRSPECMGFLHISLAFAYPKKS